MAPTHGWKQKYAALDAADIVRRFVDQGVPGTMLAREYDVKRAAIYRILKAAGVDNQRGWRHRPLRDRKLCPRCQRTLPLSDFEHIVRREPGRGGRPEPRGYCRRCWNSYSNLEVKCGLTSAQFDALVRTQGGVCAICQRPERGTRRLSVDHDHATQIIRGILCDGCNARVEVVEHRHVKRRTAGLERAERYLATARTPYRWADREHNARVDSS